VPEQTPSSEGSSHSGGQESPRLLLKREIYRRIHNSLTLNVMLSQTNPLYEFPPYLSEILSSIVLSATPPLSKLPHS